MCALFYYIKPLARTFVIENIININWLFKADAALLINLENLSILKKEL